ncbi:MAG TPA: ATP-binding protein [Vicinamibacterales bacterium]|jgi:two-component system sensor histidine kinase PilS (NtrC family)
MQAIGHGPPAAGSGAHGTPRPTTSSGRPERACGAEAHVSHAEFKRKFAWLIAIRLVISTVLLGSAILVQLNSPGLFPVHPFFLLIGLTYAVTLVSIALIGSVDEHRWIVDLELAIDAATVSAFIYLTGGVTSYFATLYMLPVAAAGALQFRRGGLLLAMFSSVLYSGLVLAQYGAVAGLLTEPWLMGSGGGLPSPRLAQYTVAVNIFGFFVVGLVSGSLADSLRHAGERLQRASSEIATLQAFNQDVIDSLMSGLATTDYAGRILTFNRAAGTITGHAPDAAVGQAVAEMLQLPPDAAAAVAADLGGARSCRADYKYRRSDARTIDLGLSATHLITPEGRAGFIFTFQDVTELRRLEHDARLRQRLAAVGEMAAGIAHEIRNPLASMAGSIQILRRELPLTPEQDQLMDIVLRESARLNDTIRSFLAYARPQRFQIERHDVRRAVNDTALLLRNSAEVHPGHTVDVDVPPVAVNYEADEGQIRQIIWNLATNGLRAMPEGGRLRLSVRTEPTRDGEDLLLIVQDDGGGMPASTVEAMFQPFHGSFEKGSGLGLAIVHRIVTDYGGRIHVDSQPGRGTTMTVRLPAAISTVAAGAAS